jgi:hypothetical protein
MHPHTMPLLLLPSLHHSSIVVSVTLAPSLCQSSLVVVLLYVINPKMFLSSMLVSSINTPDFHYIGHHLLSHKVLILFIVIFGQLQLLASWILNIILSFLNISRTTLGLFLCD